MEKVYKDSDLSSKMIIGYQIEGEGLVMFKILLYL
jgi:hypothetical protein